MTLVLAIAALLMPVLFLGAIMWLFLVARLFKRLRLDHPAKFADMGEPGLLSNNNLQTTSALLSFILSREDRELEDAALSRLTSRMRLLLAAYLACFLYVIGSIVAMSLSAGGF